MNKIEALQVTQIEGYKVTDDGQHMLLKTDLPAVLAFDERILPQLLTSVVSAIGQSATINGVPSNVKRVFPVEWWEFGLTANRDALILSFRLPDGAQLAFQVHPEVASHMRDVLASISGAPSTDSKPEEGSLQ